MFEEVVTSVLVNVKSWTPAAAVVNPVNVHAPALTLNVDAAVGLACVSVNVSMFTRPAETVWIPPVPALIVVAEVVFVDPIVNALAAPPVAIETVVAAAFAEIFIAAVPEEIVITPFVDVIFSAPDPD
jgi:hypothetical protein